jgi:RNA polymerase sigma-70 factor (ECF subfamily)
MKMWMMKDKLDEYNEPEALAVTMIRNNCIDQIRKWKHIDNEKNGSDVLAPDTSPTPYDQLVNSENAKILNMIISDLPDVYRELIEMKDIRGLSYVEISQLNNMNINTLRVNLSRARRIVKEEYSKYLYERRGTEKTAGEVL